jgi:ArsR family transcriptional regulator
MDFKCCKTKKSKNNLQQTAEFLKVIAEENRLHILCILGKGERCVCEIWQYLDLPQNLISHHLKVLKDFKLVASRKDGTKVIYSINKRTINKYNSLLTHYLNNK